jgi:hypothetical protein
MTLLFTYWKQLAVGALIVVIFLFGWYKGSSSKQLEFDAFKQEIAIQAAIAEKEYQDSLIKQETISKNITKGYADAVNKLKKHYASASHATSVRVLNNNTSGSEVSNLSNTSTGVDENTEDFVPNSFGGQDLVLHCSQDVLQLLFLQKWVEEQLK